MVTDGFVAWEARESFSVVPDEKASFGRRDVQFPEVLGHLESQDQVLQRRLGHGVQNAGGCSQAVSVHVGRAAGQ
jgi:hypothetical protein